MTLMEKIIARAKSNKQRIVLPESLEERTLTAADKALADDLAEIILIGNPMRFLLWVKNWDSPIWTRPRLSTLQQVM